MRRLVVVALLLAALPGTGSAAAPEPVRPGVRPATGRPGGVSLDPGGDRLADLQQAIAGTGPLAAEMLRRFRAETADATAGKVYDWDGGDRLGGDVDGDRVEDLVRYRTRFTMGDDGPDGWVEYSVYSGRTGTRYWTKRFEDLTDTALHFGRVGNDRPGLLAMRTRWGGARQESTEIRIVGIDARRGSVVYDRTLSDADGKGSVQFGGLFDAYPRGGTDVLLGRFRSVGKLPIEGQSLWDYEPYVLDGATGTIRAVQDTATDIAAGLAFHVTGDLDGDRRDDFVRIRREFRDTGTVTALGVSEGQVHWEARQVPLGWYAWVASAQLTGSKHDDVFVVSVTRQTGLLEIPGVTDGLPILDGPLPGGHGVLFDGDTGALRFDRHVPENLGQMFPFADYNGDGKAEVLVETYVLGKREGVRVTLVDGAGRDVLRRDITVPALLARRDMMAASYPAGDLDGDRVTDLAWIIYAESPVKQQIDTGFLLSASERVIESVDEPFYATLDGRSDERIVYTVAGDRVRLAIADGWRGAAYWSVSVPRDRRHDFRLDRQAGARGRCAGALLWGMSPEGDTYWVDVLDGKTGRVRWSKTFKGTRPAGTRPVVSGRPAACR